MGLLKYLAPAAALAFLSGCFSKPGDVAAVNGVPVALSEARDLIRGRGPHGRPATQLSDLDRLRPMFPQGYKAIKDSDIVVLWGTPLKKASDVIDGASQDILAYEKRVPLEGGYVLFSGGTIKKMTPDEFKAAPR